MLLAPEHWLVKTLGHTAWVEQLSPTEWACSWRYHDWILLRTIQRTIAPHKELRATKANWVPDPDF